jgi:hypothetical protein
MLPAQPATTPPSLPMPVPLASGRGTAPSPARATPAAEWSRQLQQWPTAPLVGATPPRHPLPLPPAPSMAFHAHHQRGSQLGTSRSLPSSSHLAVAISCLLTLGALLAWTGQWPAQFGTGATSQTQRVSRPAPRAAVCSRQQGWPTAALSVSARAGGGGVLVRHAHLGSSAPSPGEGVLGRHAHQGSSAP